MKLDAADAAAPPVAAVPRLLQGLGLSTDQIVDVRRYMTERFVCGRLLRPVPWLIALLMPTPAIYLWAFGDIPPGFRSLIQVAFFWITGLTAAATLIATLVGIVLVSALNRELFRKLSPSERVRNHLLNVGRYATFSAMLGERAAAALFLRRDGNPS